MAQSRKLFFMTASAGYTWKPIEDLPTHLKKLIQYDVKGLAEAWQRRAKELEGSESLKKFNEELQRRWAIETGIIERLYTLDRGDSERGTTRTLIEHGLKAELIRKDASDKSPEDLVLILKDQKDTVEGLFAFVKSDRQLSTSYIKELHRQLTQHQLTIDAIDSLGRKVKSPLQHGEWKESPNSPERSDGEIHEYCPPLHVQSEMDQLITWQNEHDRDNLSPEISAAWLHHRFTQIHPFQDGNGRVARALASLVFVKAGWFPLVVDRDQDAIYFDALEKADAGDLMPLIVLFSSIQKKEFTAALQLSDTLVYTLSYDQILDRAVERIQERERSEKNQIRQQASALAGKLRNLSMSHLQEVAAQINKRLGSSNTEFSKINPPSPEYVFGLRDIAERQGYWADIETDNLWLHLKILDEKQDTRIIFVFHGFGQNFEGIMAASAFMLNFTRPGEIIFSNPYALSPEPFQFPYNEPLEILESRFKKWLEEVVLLGLAKWQSQL